ncbi:MAG: hypothetical protein ACKOWF_18550 [Chloroflexota bacterium]
MVTNLVLDLVRSGGKRLRPLVLLLAARSYGGDRDAIATAAAGVELLHTASQEHERAEALAAGADEIEDEVGHHRVVDPGDALHTILDSTQIGPEREEHVLCGNGHLVPTHRARRRPDFAPFCPCVGPRKYGLRW